jgi:hypothetical protein
MAIMSVEDSCIIDDLWQQSWVDAKLQIPIFGSGPKPLEHFITLRSSQNFDGVPTSSPEFTILGSIYSYHCGWPEYSGGSDSNRNSGSSSDPKIVLSNDNRQCRHKSMILFNLIYHFLSSGIAKKTPICLK